MMEKYDMYKYNLYTILPIAKGASKEEIDKVYERYKRLNSNDIVVSKQISSILQEHYALLEEIGLEEYNKRVTNRKEDKKAAFEKLVRDLANEKHSYPPATALIMNYEEEFMQRESDKVEFDKSKVKNVNQKKINQIRKKAVVVVATAAIAITSVVGVGVWNANKNSEPIYSDDSTSISTQNEPETYTFKYIVQSGDTYVSIRQKFGLYTPEDNYVNNMIYEGQEMPITVSDRELAEQWQRIYEIQTIDPIMVEWDDYVVQSGDTPFSIAKNFNVNLDYLMKFNNTEYYKAIPDINTCYVGVTIKIPTKILVGEDAYNYKQAKMQESNNLKAVG